MYSGAVPRARTSANKTSGTRASPRKARASSQWSKDQQLARDLAVQPYTTRLGEILATIKANQAKKELTTLQAKIEFQALFV